MDQAGAAVSGATITVINAERGVVRSVKTDGKGAYQAPLLQPGAYELRVDEPLIKLHVFRDKAFSVDAAVLFFAMLAFVPLFFFASVYAQVSLSASPNQAALFLLYFFIGFAIASQWGGRILDKRGARPAPSAGS